MFEDKPCKKSLGLEKLAVGRNDLLPVSYTHLDVYKRQLQVGAAHTFPFRVPDSLFHVVHPVL